MRRAALFLVLFFTAAVPMGLAAHSLTGVPGGALFSQAAAKYQAGDFAGAISLNQRVINEAGVESGEVYFNLANSYFRAGQLGRAVLCYLRAERLEPRDGDIRANLAFARQAVEQNDQGKPLASRSRWFAVFSSLSSAEFKWTALLSFMLAGVVFLWCLYAGLPARRVWLWTGLAAIIAGYILLAFCARYFDLLGRAVVLTRTEARFEPSTEATVYFKVPEGAEVKILRQKAGWLKVQRSDGRSGWVPENTSGAI